MTGPAFAAAIRQHPQLHRGSGPRDDMVYVVYTPGDEVKVGWEVDPDSIWESTWRMLEEVLTGKRRARIMRQLCRIVGYYSFMESWNRSKLVEARDRQKGNYRVSEPAA